MQRAWLLAAGLGLWACGKPEQTVQKEPEPAAQVAVQALGAPIPTKGASVALADVAAAPEKFREQAFVATGTIGSVCQNRGCWMTLSDENGEAFVRITGHAFAIPKDASGRKARVMATLAAPAEEAEGSTCGEGKAGGCKAEAQEQQGEKPLAKLELQASGVELF